MDLMDIYSDFLIYQPSYASATSLAQCLDHRISHDKIARFLKTLDSSPHKLWNVVKPLVRQYQNEQGVLILDDAICEKPYTDENPINCWHFSHAKGRCIKGIQILTTLINYGEINLPISF
jgi:hypothetical protein